MLVLLHGYKTSYRASVDQYILSKMCIKLWPGEGLVDVTGKSVIKISTISQGGPWHNDL